MGKASKPESSRTRPITAFFQYMTGTPKTKENTNTIGSYFLSDSKPRPNSSLLRRPASPPITLGPTSSPGPDASETAEDGDTKESDSRLAKEASTKTTASQAPKPQSQPGQATEPHKSPPTSPNKDFLDPIHHDFDTLEDPNYHIEDYEQPTNTGLETHSKPTPTTTPSTQRIKQDFSPFESDLDSIDRLGSYTFGSQVSGESLRRLTLSPRKAKLKKEEMRSLLSVPTKSFAERLAAQGLIERLPNDEDTHGQIKSESGANPTGDHEDEAVIAGSDPESEPDWNDEILETPIEARVPTESSVSLSPPPRSISSPSPRSQSPDSDSNDTLHKDYCLSSDDEFSSSKKDKSKKIPFELVESDSDLEDHPFAMGASKISSGSSTPLPGLTPLSLNTDLDLELTDDEGDQGTKPTRRSTRASRNTVKYTPMVPMKKAAPKKPALFSLASLLKEKEQRAKAGYDLHAAARSMAELDNELLEEIGDEDYLDEFTPAACVIPKGVLSEEQEGALAEIIEEDDTEIVDDIVEFFVHWPRALTVVPLKTTDIDTSDPTMLKVVQRTGTKTKRDAFLSGRYLTSRNSTFWTMPKVLFSWLVHVLSVEQNAEVCTCIFVTLQRALLKKTSIVGVDYQDLVRAFKLYGAKDEYLSPEWQVTPVTQQTATERVATSNTPKFPKNNLKAIIDLVNLTATIDPLFYAAADIRKIVLLLLRITTDPIVGDIKSLLGATLVSLLEAIPTDAWESERHTLCQEINASLGTSLPFILLVLHRLPSLSERMVTIRRNLALIHLGFSPMQKDQVAPNLDAIHRALFLDPQFLANSKTDYKALGYRFQVLSYCLDDDHVISTYGPETLTPVVSKLKQMHGRIVDVRAAFMDRTQTKDVIQRLSTRLYFAGIHRQAPRQTTLNFAVKTES
ncbi:hypothetical protein BGZ74_002435 [Mortierella antarctica]|nr:hypothetical protein BGZ74_002435 [Mortierella antarctica]